MKKEIEANVCFVRRYFSKIVAIFVVVVSSYGHVGAANRTDDPNQQTFVPSGALSIEEIDDTQVEFWIDLNDGRVQYVDVGSVTYGLEQTKLLILFSSGGPLSLTKAALDGCASCSDMQIRSFAPVDNNEGCLFKLELVFNKRRVLPAAAIHAKSIRLGSEDGRQQYQVNIAYRIVPTPMMEPNYLSYEKAIPEQPYSVTLTKNGDFDIVSLCLEGDNLDLLNWKDSGKSVEFCFKVKHTFKDTQVISDAKALTSGGKAIIIPLCLDVKEYVYIDPMYINLGLLKCGETVIRKLVVKADRKFSVHEFWSDFNDVECTVIKSLPLANELEIKFINKVLKMGAFKKKVKFTIFPYNEVISVPVYAVCIRNPANQF